MKLTLLALTVFASLAPGTAAPRPQYPGMLPTRKLGTQEQYRPNRAALLLRGPVRSVFEEAYNMYPDGKGIFTGNATYVFDRRGRLVEFMRGNNVLRDLYDDRFTYRADGRVASVERLFDRKPASRDVYAYDDARGRVEVKTYRAEDNFLGMILATEYDARGNQTRSEMELLAQPGDKGPPIKHVTETSYDYDEKGRPASTTVKYDGLTLVTFGSRREADGRLVTTTKDFREAARSKLAKTVVTYDSRGDELSTEAYAADGTLTSKITYERKFDARGNWVEEVTRTWDKGDESPRESSFLSRRKIEYF